ncbi:hypothetical protein STEG23_026341, partial [Scotinomys teguina]
NGTFMASSFLNLLIPSSGISCYSISPAFESEVFKADNLGFRSSVCQFLAELRTQNQTTQTQTWNSESPVFGHSDGNLADTEDRCGESTMQNSAKRSQGELRSPAYPRRPPKLGLSGSSSLRLPTPIPSNDLHGATFGHQDITPESTIHAVKQPLLAPDPSST